MQKLFLYRSKWFKYRKFVCFVAMLFTLLTMGATQSVQAQDMNAKKISLQLNSSGIKAALAAIQQKGGFKFVYGPDLNKYNNVKVTLNGNYTVKQAVDQVLKNTNLRYTQRGGNVMIDEKPAGNTSAPRQEQGKAQQNGRISGKVLDDRGEPLIGASIRIVGNNSLATQSATDGSYSLSLKPGTYALEVSYISFQTQRITEVIVKENSNTPLTIAMVTETNTLSQVVVSAGYKKASVAGLYAEQKNRASVSDGISSEQIARTPDNNMGQVLKRVSGVTTVDNKYVVVRGLSERYNQAMIDGVTLPSTSMNRRNFSFDVIPQELVSNVVVNKTATPDMPAEFSGGQISVNTMDIPTENFTMVSIGSGMNSQSTGKDFLMLGERKGADYFGMGNSRKEPDGIQPWQFPNGVNTPPLGAGGNYPAELPADAELLPGSGIPYRSLDAIAQSRKIDVGGLKLNSYKTLPFQNARVALGRVYDLKDNLRFGFSGGVTYRNQQTIVTYNNVRGAGLGDGDFMNTEENNPGTSYRFNSTIGAALNLGLQGNNFKIALKNMYSRIFEDNFNEAYRINYGASNPNKYREQFQDPQATKVWQHKLEGENLLGNTGIKLAYTAGITNIGQQVQDQRRLKYRRSATIGGVDYFQTPNLFMPSDLGRDYDYRLWTDVDETDYNWGLSFSKDFMLGKSVKNTAKIGYSGWDKHRTLGMNRLIPYTGFSDINNPIEGAYGDILSPEKVGAEKGQAYYYAQNLSGRIFDGKMASHAPYVMLDQRFFEKLRLVYGIRAEHYNLANKQDEYLSRDTHDGKVPDSYAAYATTGEKDWRILPSANLTYSLTPKMNARLAYSKTAIRPDFRETAYFGMYDIDLDAFITGMQVASTIVDNFDLRYEWYPAAGEVISVSGFYKKLKDPIELVWAQEGVYRFQNQYAATNYGIEMEVRKTLGFIADKPWLHNITLFGNGTLLKSEVGVQDVPMPGDLRETERLPAQNRPLYGQAPWIINGGIAYQDDIFGFTASYNRSGHRSNTIHQSPEAVEYEQGRNLLDVQLSAKVLKRKAEVKLNLGNLLDEYILFYQNESAYENIPIDPNNPNSQSIGWKLKSGNTTAYEKDKGDRVTYRAKTGRNMTLSFTYNF